MPWVWVNGSPKWVTSTSAIPTGARQGYQQNANYWTGTDWSATPPATPTTTPAPGQSPAPTPGTTPTPTPTPTPTTPAGPVDQYARARERENQDYTTATERLNQQKADYEAMYGRTTQRLSEDKTLGETAYQLALSRLGESQDVALKNLVDTLNKRNLFYSGARGRFEGDLGRQYDERRTDMGTSWQNQLLGFDRRTADLTTQREQQLQAFLQEAADLLLGHTRELEDIDFAQAEAARIKAEEEAAARRYSSGGGGYYPGGGDDDGDGIWYPGPDGGGGNEPDEPFEPDPDAPELDPINPPSGFPGADRNAWFALDPEQQHKWMSQVHGKNRLPDGSYAGFDFYYWDNEWGWTPVGWQPGMPQGDIVAGRYRWVPGKGWQTVSPVTTPAKPPVTTINPPPPSGQNYGDPFMGGPQGGRRTTTPGTPPEIDGETAASYSPAELASLGAQYGVETGYELFYYWTYYNYPSPSQRDALMKQYPQYAGAIDEGWYDAMHDKTGGIGSGGGQM